MAAESISKNREGAEILYEDAICRKKISDLLRCHNLPNNLLPLKDVTECGYNKSTGFFWAKQRSINEHNFTAINRIAKYDEVTTAFLEDRKMRDITGVKAKPFVFWFTVREFSIDDNDSSKLSFVTSIGARKSFPFSAFEQ